MLSPRGQLDQGRYDSFLKLRRELAHEDARTARERKEQERRYHRVAVKEARKRSKRIEH
jgi:hypothetical protein